MEIPDMISATVVLSREWRDVVCGFFFFFLVLLAWSRAGTVNVVLWDCFSPDPLTRGIRLSWDFLLLLLCLLVFRVVSLFSAHVRIYRTQIPGERPRVSYSSRVFLESQGPYPVHVLFFVY